MVISIENLLESLNSSDTEERKNKLIVMVLESIALSKDNIIMTELMLDILQKNTTLNRQLEIQIEEIKRLSVTDQLTGLFNRRKLIEALEKELNRVSHYNHPFSLVMFDIDHFKNVNDTYGHDIGDFVLKELSNLVKSRLRTSDTFSRWGGEEFMILAPETDIDVGEKLAETIRTIIEEHSFAPVSQITCSFGVTICDRESICDIKTLSENVDKALYEAKESGRNRVVIYNEK